MKKKILIIGSSGNIGTLLTSNLREEFVIYEISSKKKNNSNPNIINLSLYSKILKIKKIKKFEKINFRAIIFLSTIRNRNDCHKIFYLINNTVELLKKLKYQKFINFSSISVYQKNKKKLYDIDSKLWPILNSDFEYSVNKVITEMYFFHYFYSLNINKFINLRVGQVFGNYSNKQSILYKLTQSVVKNEKFTIYGHGKRTITYILEKDLILLIKKLIINNSKHLNINAITSSTNIKTLIKDFIKQNQNKKLIYEFKNNLLESNERYKIKKNYNV